MKLTDERPAETDIRLSLASHLYIYPLGIAEDILVEVVEHVYPVDFVILDIKEYEKRPFISETPFLTTAKAVVKFDKGTITLRSGKSKISFHRILESLYLTNKIACRKFLIKDEEEIFTDAGDSVGIYPDGVASPVMLYLTRRSLEDLRMFSFDDSWKLFNQLSHISSLLLRKPGEY
ncbi:hypothetical protein Tco_0811482 [Tanacetum coccineum]